LAGERPNETNNLSVRRGNRVSGYLAFSAARYPQSVVEITGLTAPT
jgi:hypothetical protein